MFNRQLTVINGGYEPAWNFNGSLMGINGDHITQNYMSKLYGNYMFPCLAML